MGTTSEKLTYLNTTKTLIKEELNLGGANITNEPFRAYKGKLEGIYKDFLANGTDALWNNWEKVSGSGTEITLNNTIEAKMDFVYKGNTSQKTTTGKNLFDVNSVTSVTNGTISDEIITTNETSNSTYSVFPYFSNISLPANTYYLSMDIRIKSGTGNFNKINDATTEWTAVSKPSLSTTFQRYVYSHTYTSVTTLNHILIQFISSTNAVYEIKNIMISTSSDTSYEPYTGGNPAPNPDYPQDIQVVSGDNTIKVEGKNLFDGELELGSYNGGTGDKKTANDNYRNKNIIEVKPNTTYTFSINGVSQKYVLFYYTSSQSFIRSTTGLTTGTFTTPNNCYYINFRCFASDFTSDFANLKVQLEKGSEATDFMPYQSASYPINIGNIELCKIGTYQDKIYKDNGKWYLNKQIGKGVLNGSENWTYISVAQGSLFRNNNVILDEIKNNTYVPYSKYYQGISYNNYQNRQNNQFYINSDNNFLDFIDNRYTTANDFKTWLGTHNTTVYYVLATPTTTEITDTTLISQLEAIKKSYNTQTSISQVNNDLPFELDVVALGELESI